MGRKKPTRFDWVRDAEEPVTPRKERITVRERQAVSDDADALIDPLLGLPKAALEPVPLSDDARRALEILRSITSNVAKKRQRGHLSAILRGLDLPAIAEAIGQGSTRSTARDLQLESLVRWRARMVRDGDEVIQAFVDEYPSADRQRIRQFVGRIRNDPRSRSAKLLMTLLKEAAGI